MTFRELPSALADLVLPSDCAGCGRPPVRGAGPWCPACAAGVGPPRRVWLPGGPAVVAAGRYAGPLRTAVLRYKERGRRDLARPLAGLLLPLLPHAPPPVWLVPVPSRPAAARERGGDHVLRLCRMLAAGRDGVVVAPVLRLARGARDSVGLDAGERAANLAGRLRVGVGGAPAGGWPATAAGATVLLVDDVVTTGATVRACRGALAGAGLTVATAAVLCDATGRSDAVDRPPKAASHASRQWATRECHPSK